MRAPRRILLASAFVWIVGVLPGCDCGGGTRPTCRTSSECRAGQVCVDSRCTDREEIDGDVIEPDTGSSDCVDFDRDGLGAGCALGPDCDDSNPMIGGSEVCDTLDNDCDGMTDEGLEICTSCTPACEIDGHPGPGGWMPTPENSEGVIVDMGELTLGRTMAEAFSVWVANSDEATVSRLRWDATMGRIVELGRYPTVSSAAPAGTRPWRERCGWGSPAIGNCPSRTAVDQNFDAYVANRAFGNQGSLTKYANDEADCVDRNSNGVIDTSRDLNGDGVINFNPDDPATFGPGFEFVGPDDECILYTVAVGPNDAWPRALAIGVAPPDAVVGDVWVGLFQGRQACRLDPTDGSTIACVAINSLQPYGGAADAMGRIWFVDRSGSRRDVLGWVDPITMGFTSASPVPGFSECMSNGELQPYGITVDGEGHVYIVNSVCQPQILRYTIATDTWDRLLIPGGGTPRGVAADEMHLWVGLSHEGNTFSGAVSQRVEQLRIADFTHVATRRTPSTTGIVGVGVSFDGSVWAIGQTSNSAARYDPATDTWSEAQVGLVPYTYSDFIGFGLNVFAQPRGRYRFRLEGCAGGEFGGQSWLGARVDATIPAMTEVTIWVRVANTPEELEAATFIGPFPVPLADFRMAPGPIPMGRYIDVELRLRTDDRRTAPRIRSIDVAGECTSGG